MVKIALDTSVLAYAEGVNGTENRGVALKLVRHLPAEIAIVPVQVFGELFNVLVRKAGRARGEAQRPTWLERRLPCRSDIRRGHAGGCRQLISEVLQDGFTWGGVTVVNPFADAALP